MKNKKELTQLIREEIYNILKETGNSNPAPTIDKSLGEFGEVVTSPNDLEENQVYNIYDPKENKWYFEYEFRGFSNYFDEYVFGYINQYDRDKSKPVWYFTVDEMIEWVKGGYITLSI